MSRRGHTFVLVRRRALIFPLRIEVCQVPYASALAAGINVHERDFLGRRHFRRGSARNQEKSQIGVCFSVEERPETATLGGIVEFSQQIGLDVC